MDIVGHTFRPGRHLYRSRNRRRTTCLVTLLFALLGGAVTRLTEALRHEVAVAAQRTARTALLAWRTRGIPE